MNEKIKKLLHENNRLGDELDKKLEEKYPDYNILFLLVVTEKEIKEQIKKKKEYIMQIDNGTFIYLNKQN